MDCLGCRIANGIEPGVNIVLENALITCVLDIAPFNEGHVLILPKNHFMDLEEMDSVTAHALFDASMVITKMIKTIFKPDGITICQNGGIFNDLCHYHMHAIPRYEGDGFTWGEPLRNDGAANRLLETKQKFVNVPGWIGDVKK